MQMLNLITRESAHRSRNPRGRHPPAIVQSDDHDHRGRDRRARRPCSGRTRAGRSLKSWTRLASTLPVRAAHRSSTAISKLASITSLAFSTRVRIEGDQVIGTIRLTRGRNARRPSPISAAASSAACRQATRSRHGARAPTRRATAPAPPSKWTSMRPVSCPCPPTATLATRAPTTAPKRTASSAISPPALASIRPP